MTKCSSFCHPAELCTLTRNGRCLMKGKPDCYNRPPFKHFLEVRTGWTEDGRRITAFIPDPMSKDCSSIKPPFGEAYLKGWDCSGCTWYPK